MAYQRVTLKVCEGCGTLWFRTQAGANVYCAPCTDVLQHFPDPKTRRLPGRRQKNAGRPEVQMPMMAMAGAR